MLKMVSLYCVVEGCLRNETFIMSRLRFSKECIVEHKLAHIYYCTLSVTVSVYHQSLPWSPGITASVSPLIPCCYHFNNSTDVTAGEHDSVPASVADSQ